MGLARPAPRSTTSKLPAPTASSTPSPPAGVRCWADKGYQGARGTIRVPCRGRCAKIRAVGEQAMATLKGWRLLRKPRCSPSRITNIVKAVLALHLNTPA